MCSNNRTNKKVFLNLIVTHLHSFVNSKDAQKNIINFVYFTYCNPVHSVVLLSQERGRNKKKGKVKTMTREEIINRIETLENKMFYLKMKDHWTPNDFETDRKMYYEVKELKKELENN